MDKTTAIEQLDQLASLLEDESRKLKPRGPGHDYEARRKRGAWARKYAREVGQILLSLVEAGIINDSPESFAKRCHDHPFSFFMAMSEHWLSPRVGVANVHAGRHEESLGYARATRQFIEQLGGITDSVKPNWDRNTGKLWFAGQCVRKFKSVKRAAHSAKILDAFQEEDWPDFVYNPIGEDNQQLKDAIRSLNNGLTLIKFRIQSASILWQPVGSE